MKSGVAWCGVVWQCVYLRDRAERDWLRGATGVTEGDR